MLPLFYLVFVLSGAAGLIYESIWTRYLGLFVGHSAYAQVIVLVIFLGGMSLGALLIGKRSERIQRPLFWYAIIELATGVIGLVFHDLFVATTNLAYANLFPSLGIGAAQTIAKWGIASFLILPQSILLGMTFPLMSAGIIRRVPERSGGALSMLYFANSLGAAVGVLAAGFWLVAAAGLPGTLLVAAIINISVAAVVIVTLRMSRLQETSAPVVAAHPEVSGLSRPGLWRLLLAVSFGTALSSFIYEIGWIRMLALVLGSATHSFELMLSAFILGLALGALWVRRRADSNASSLRFLGYVQLAMGSLAIMTLPIYLESFGWMASLMAAFAKTPEGYTLFSAARYAVCLAVMLPATFCAGMTLPLITRMLVGSSVGERAIGQVYGVNTLGSIIGAALAGLVLMPLLGLKWLLVAGASVDIALGLALFAAEWRLGSLEQRARWFPRLAIASALAAAVIAVSMRAKLDQTVLTSGVYRYGNVQAAGSRKVLFYKDGRTATVSVRRLPETGGLTLGTNGKPDASLGPEWLDTTTKDVKRGQFTHDAPTQLFVPLVALAHAPGAKTAAVIGHGSGMTSHALLGSPAIESLVTIEIEPEMIKASRAFYPANARAFDDKRNTFAIDDARAYFASRGRTFDLIISEPSNPWVSGVSGLFTEEFYGRVKTYLTPTGVFAQWLHLYEIDDALVLSVVAALTKHFPTYSIFNISNKDIIIVATTRPQLPAPDWKIFEYPALAQDLKHVWPLTPQTMETLRVADNKSLEPLVRLVGAPNSDFYPTLDLNAERTRYMKTEAAGFSGLASGRVNFAAMVDGRRNGLGDSYAIVNGVPRLEAMAVAAALRNGDTRPGASVGLLATRKMMLEAEMAAGRPPADWEVWTRSVEFVEQGIHGGMAGYVDDAFYATVRGYLARAKAPEEPRAAVDFLHGIGSWNYAEASRAADVLLAAAGKGRLWLDADVLRDGAVMAKLAVGDRRGARAAFRGLISRSTRSISDVRTRLLYSYVIDSTETPVLSSRH
jgi:predicted membrane-bound spermidine synthase